MRVLFIYGLFVVTVITKYHKLGGFHNRNVFLTVLSLEFQDQGFGRFSFSESFPSSFANDLDLLTVFLPGLSSAYTPLVSLPPLKRTAVLLGKDLFLMISFNLNYFFKDLSPNTVTWRLGVSTYELWGDYSSVRNGQ